MVSRSEEVLWTAGAASVGLSSVAMGVSSLRAQDHEMKMSAIPAFYRAVTRHC